MGKYTFIIQYYAFDSVKRVYCCQLCRHSIVFWKAEIYTPSVFRIYAEIHGYIYIYIYIYSGFRQRVFKALMTTKRTKHNQTVRLRVILINATFNNISSWWSVLLVEETGENHRPVACHWHMLSHYVISTTTSPSPGFELTTLVVICTACTGRHKPTTIRLRKGLHRQLNRIDSFGPTSW